MKHKVVAKSTFADQCLFITLFRLTIVQSTFFHFLFAAMANPLMRSSCLVITNVPREWQSTHHVVIMPVLCLHTTPCNTLMCDTKQVIGLHMEWKDVTQGWDAEAHLCAISSAPLSHLARAVLKKLFPLRLMSSISGFNDDNSLYCGRQQCAIWYAEKKH